MRVSIERECDAGYEASFGEVGSVPRDMSVWGGTGGSTEMMEEVGAGREGEGDVPRGHATNTPAIRMGTRLSRPRQSRGRVCILAGLSVHSR
jgi:hypothetical protein